MPTVPSFLRAGWSLARALLRRERGTLTLDQLRSDLSHEPASKLGRLSGLVQSWRRGDRRPGDVVDAQAILDDLERPVLRHARLACARPDTWRGASRVLGAVYALRSALTGFARDGALTPVAVEAFASRLDSLRASVRGLVESLSSRHAARLLDLGREAVAEIRRELGRDDASAVEIAFEGPEQMAATWVAAADVAAWSDLIRNFARNAVQACEDRVLAEGRATADGGGPLRVTVSVSELPDAPGTVIEVVDAGVGMTSAAAEAMWRAGESTHGALRGQGLTEGKRVFLLARASLEVRSAPGVGTSVRIAVPYRDVPVRVPHLWQMPTLLPVPIVLLAVAVAGLLFVAPHPLASVESTRSSFVRALDARGHVVWQGDLREVVSPNFRPTWLVDDGTHESTVPHPLLAGPDGRLRDVLLASQPRQGPGHLMRLSTNGVVVWRRTFAWQPPRIVHTGNLKSVFQRMVPWTTGTSALAINVRDEDYSATAVQFFATDGESLGAYYHPGQLEFVDATDLDGDGRSEVLLAGSNNVVAEDPEFLGGGDGPAAEVGCVVALSPPAVDGQAFPWRTWVRMPHASEWAYLAVPPLPGRIDGKVARLREVPSSGPGTARIELQIADGRIYRLDEHLRPIECGVGDRTAADSLLPLRHVRPLYWLTHGVLEPIDLPIRRGS